MRSQNPQSLLVTLVTSIFILSLCFFLINSCKKIDKESLKENNPENPMSAKFFSAHRSSETQIKAVQNFVLHQNDKYQFIDKLISRIGYPYWNKAVIFSGKVKNESSHRSSSGSDSSSTIVYIPFARDSQQYVNSSLVLKMNETDTSFKFLYDWQYANYGFDSTTSLNARTVASILMLLDREVFGHELFRVTDHRLFDHLTNSKEIIRIKPVSSTGSRLEPVTTLSCYTISYETAIIWTDDHWWEPQGGDWVTETYCYSWTYWVNVPDYFPPPGGSNGDGGGGAWSDADPCSGNAAKLAPGDDGGSDCDPGWEPILQNRYYDLSLYDTIRINDALKNSYPCTAAFIIDSLPNINYLAQLAGASVFHDSAFMHLTFDTSTVYTQPLQPSGETVSGGVFVDPDGLTHFKATIRLNGWHLRHGTKEFMVSTIVHECMHAIFNLRWGQYQQWLRWGPPNPIDSFYIKQHFPIHWYWITSQNIPLSGLQDHEIMATDYFELFAALVRPFYNSVASPDLRDSVIKAMNYGGLRQTTAWKLLPGKGIDTCKYKNIQVTAENALIGTYNSGGSCTNFTAHYADSLKLRPSCN